MAEFSKSSLRYANKLNINPEMAQNKILSRIKEGSTVLEFGPSSGVMTRVLSEDMSCSVSIIECDEECYERAIRYAKDGFWGDIESYEWQKTFKGRKYDYILFVDVLEHLRNPWDVLKSVDDFLKDNGAVLISVPNISHNSVIIQLINNQFIYGDTGILDYTHLHHFTITEILNLIDSVGYISTCLDATYIAVGQNEFPVSYGSIDLNIAEVLKNRPFGEVYQHIIEARKKDYVINNNIEIENYLGTPKSYIESAERHSEESELDSCIENILAKNPNFFWGTNNEIARMRLEINDLYNAYHDLDKVKDFRRRISDMQVEIDHKNQHISSILQEEEEHKKNINRLMEDKVVSEKKEAGLKDIISQLNKEKEEEESRIIYLQGELDSLKENINEIKAENKEKTSRIRILEDEQKESNKTIIKLSNDIDANESKILLLQNECNDYAVEIEKLKKENADCNNYVHTLQRDISEKDRIIYDLDVIRAEYEHEKTTRSYRIGKKLQRVNDKILPPDSNRRFWLRRTYNWFRHPRIMARVMSPRRAHELHILKLREGIFKATDRFDALFAQEKEYLEQQSLSHYEHIELHTSDQPDVSVIIPVYNQFGYTYKCLKSISENTDDVKYEVIIADDCSTDLTKKISQIVSGIRVVRNNHNLRFLLNCNNAAKYARGKHIHFLNNDTEVKKGWLSSILEIFQMHDDAGIVGSKLVYPDGRLQEAGGIVWKDASAWNYGNGQDPEAPEYNYVKEVDYISGASIMIRKDLWDKIGGFDEQFAPAYCEDTDLAFQVRECGYKVFFQPKSVVVHYEGISNGTDITSGLKAYQVQNQVKFFEKWKNILQEEHFDNNTNVFIAKDRSRFKKNILVVDHYVPNHDKDAGGRCTYMYIKTFLKLGMKVTFIGDNYAKPEPYSTELEQLGVEILYGGYYFNNWKDWLKENLKFFDYVYLQRPHISHSQNQETSLTMYAQKRLLGGQWEIMSRNVLPRSLFGCIHLG